MVAVQVMSHDTAVGMAASQGNFQLNVFMPVLIYNFLQSVRLLSECIVSFTRRCVAGIKPDREKMKSNLYNSLMLVTALSPHLGYDQAAAIANEASASGRTLREVVLERGLLDRETLDRALDPRRMTSV